jgi:hypothetical protein
MISILKRFSRLKLCRSKLHLIAVQVDPEIEKFKEIARAHRYRGHGGFLTAFLEAFLKADEENSRILLPAMKTFCEKYNLSSNGRCC